MFAQLVVKIAISFGNPQKETGSDFMIESLNTGASAKETRVVLFDFDGTISLLRTGWEEVMVPMMVDILAETGTKESKRRTPHSGEGVRGPADRGADNLPNDRACPANRVARREAAGASRYKKMYHDRLMEKIDRAKGRSAARERFRRKNTWFRAPVSLLEALQSAGLKLYCASGTDHELHRGGGRAAGYRPLF